MWEGIQLSQDEFDKFDEVYDFNEAKRRKTNRSFFLIFN